MVAYTIVIIAFRYLPIAMVSALRELSSIFAVLIGWLFMREKLTAVQAVLMAGGFKDSAKSSQILVFRKLNADTAEVRSLNFRTLTRTRDLENDLTLQAGDMILVPRNRISKLERYVRIASLAAFLNPLPRY